LRTDTNEKAEVRELRGVASKDLIGALREIEAVASGARSKRPFYHASINTRSDELMTPEQWTQAIDRLEQELKFTGQPRAVVAHLKEGRAHVHIAWSRIDIDSLKAISDSHNYRRHEIVARELEREFGHARVQGAHIERDGQERPARTPSHAEMQQSERSGMTPQQAKILLSEIWNRTDSGQAFAAAIQEQGWALARGDQRDFVVLDPAGETHSLGRRIEGARATDVRARMADLDAAALPNVDAAKAQHHAREQERLADLERLKEPNPDAVSVTTQGREPQPQKQGWHRPTPESSRIAYEEEKQRKHGNNPATTNAGMVAQQREATRRFEQSSADMEAQRRARLAAFDKAKVQRVERDGPGSRDPSPPRGRTGR
jgi:hypothetical protein